MDTADIPQSPSNEKYHVDVTESVVQVTLSITLQMVVKREVRSPICIW